MRAIGGFRRSISGISPCDKCHEVNMGFRRSISGISELSEAVEKNKRTKKEQSGGSISELSDTYKKGRS